MTISSGHASFYSKKKEYSSRVTSSFAMHDYIGCESLNLLPGHRRQVRTLKLSVMFGSTFFKIPLTTKVSKGSGFGHSGGPVSNSGSPS